MTPKLLLAAAALSLAAAARAQSPDLKDIDVKAIKGDIQLSSKGGDSTACSLQESDFSYQLARAKEGPFTVFIAKKDGNAFQLCLNGRQTIFGTGIIVPGSLKRDGDDLVFDTVHPKASIPHADVVAGKLRGSEWAGASRVYELAQRYRHRIAVDKLSYESLNEGTSGSGTATLEKLAWLTIVLDPRKEKSVSLAVRLKDDEPGQAEKLVRKALALPKLEGGVTDGASVEQIAGFVRSETGKYRDKKLPLVSTPMVWVELSPKKDSDEPSSVASILARGRKAGVDKQGQDIVDAMDYDELLFCKQRARLEKRSAHDAHLSAAVKSAAAK